MLIFLFSFLTLAYALLMLVYRQGWQRQQVFRIAASFTPNTYVSVIIPARNEALHIRACIQSILDQQYPEHLLEIIVVDDFSEDGTAAIVKSFNQSRVHCLSLSDNITEGGKIYSYKKMALSLGIRNATGSLIITTDADCVAGPQWVRHLAALYQQDDPVMIAAPVDYTTGKSLLHLFQSLDFMTMQGITGAAHQYGLGHMANGANLAFGREAFKAVSGYDGVDHLASGDDFLLLMKMQQQYSGRIRFLKAPEAIVHTAPQPDWNSFLQQRIRWASKSGKYPDHRLTAILLLVYLFNCSFPVSVLYVLWHHNLWWLPAAMLGVKIIAELYFLLPVARFFRKMGGLYLFPLLQPLHIGYIIMAGFLGLAGNYSWKGRKVR